MKIGTLLCTAWIATVITTVGAARPAAIADSPARQNRSTTADQLPAGEGHDAFLAMCSDCHDLDTAIGRRRQPKDWHDLVELMRQRGANGEDADAAVVVKYLTRHFGKVDVNRAPAADLMLVLNVDQSAADKIIAARPFASADALAALLGIDTRTQPNWKDRIVDIK